MKFTRKTLLETLRRKNEGWTTYQTRKIAGISIRRVNQVWREYQETGRIPEVGRRNGRPEKQLEEWEKGMAQEAYKKYRVSASTLERLIQRDYKKKISHNRIHKVLLSLGYAKKKQKKDVRKKKWIRYERRHSLTAVHIDWHDSGRQWVFGVEDDASRKILALIECEHATTDESIVGMEIAIRHGKIKQCISDHGAQFICNTDEESSRFKTFLERHGIKQILCRVKHPQSNGKIERWFDTYKRHRKSFGTKKEFLTWYNEVRPHRSLKFDVLETPEEAFIRKMKKEV